MYNNNDDFLDLFEKRLCEYTGAPHAVVVDRCTNAILLSLKCLGTDLVTIPRNTYLSVPMVCLNYGIKVIFDDRRWEGNYQFIGTRVYDYAVGFEKDMYVPGQIQCLSFQQKKRLAIGKGGAILLDDEEMANRLRRLRYDGRNSRIPESKEDPNDIILGYHMNMSPDEAARGILLMNQLSEEYTLGSYKEYIDVTNLRCFRDQLRINNSY